jgi:hypothetical protein
LSEARAEDRRSARDDGKLLALAQAGSWKQIEKNAIKANMLLKTNDGNLKTNWNELKNEPKLGNNVVG